MPTVNHPLRFIAAVGIFCKENGLIVRDIKSIIIGIGVSESQRLPEFYIYMRDMRDMRDILCTIFVFLDFWNQ